MMPIQTTKKKKKPIENQANIEASESYVDL